MPLMKIPTPMRSYVDGQSEVRVRGSTAGDALEDLLTRFPALRPHITKADGKPRAFVNLFVGQNHIRDLQGLHTPVGETDELRLVLSVAGG